MGEQRPTEARNPDTVFLLALLLVSGGGQLVSGAEPGSVQALIPGWMGLTWALTLTTAAGITLTGILWRGRVTGLLVEAVGRVMLAPAALAYAVAIAFAAGLSGAIPIGLVFGLALSSGYRLWQIRRDIRHLQESMAVIAERQAE